MLLAAFILACAAGVWSAFEKSIIPVMICASIVLLLWTSVIH